MSLMDEAKRIKEVARRSYKPSIHLTAVLENSNKQKLTIEYFNPSDIPEAIILRGRKYFLTHVERYKPRKSVTVVKKKKGIF